VVHLVSQDLSVAGKRAGLSGERSGLFMDQVRIVKEMREHDVRVNGRTGQYIRPRYMVWENVPGSFSSGNPKGADFAAVLEEILKIVQENAVVDVPEKGWPNAGCIQAEDGSFSVAYRVHDGQFWGATYFDSQGGIRRFGTPQRRRRISLVADFGGLSASEILYIREGLQRNYEQGEFQGEKITGSIAECTPVSDRSFRRSDGESNEEVRSITLQIRGGR